jgi:NADH-quinone oxidoreductase subunit M
MGLVVMGFATLTPNGFVGAGVQMVSHGVMTALFFAVVGMIYDQAHTREIPKLGGMIRFMPFAAVAFIIGGLVSMGMPGFSGFIAEFPIFMGVWQSNPWIAIIAVISIVVTAAYIMRAVGRVFFGELPAELEGHIHDISRSEKVALAVLCVILVGVGLFPGVMVPMVEAGVNSVLRLVGG